eukprot:jgi/Bigna1/87693/estExt_fgenesh1_pg.C_230065
MEETSRGGGGDESNRKKATNKHGASGSSTSRRKKRRKKKKKKNYEGNQSQELLSTVGVTRHLKGRRREQEKLPEDTKEKTKPRARKRHFLDSSSEYYSPELIDPIVFQLSSRSSHDEEDAKPKQADVVTTVGRSSKSRAATSAAQCTKSSRKHGKNPPPRIRGHYFDEEKGRYFKLDKRRVTRKKQQQQQTDKKQRRGDGTATASSNGEAGSWKCGEVRDIGVVRGLDNKNGIRKLHGCPSQTALACCSSSSSSSSGASSNRPSQVVIVAGGIAPDGCMTRGTLELTSEMQANTFEIKSERRYGDKISSIAYIPSSEAVLYTLFGSSQPGSIKVSLVKQRPNQEHQFTFDLTLSKGTIWNSKVHPDFKGGTTEVAVGTSRNLAIINIARPDAIREYFSNKSGVWALDYASNGNEIRYGTRRGELRVIDTRSAPPVRVKTATLSMEMSPWTTTMTVQGRERGRGGGRGGRRQRTPSIGGQTKQHCFRGQGHGSSSSSSGSKRSRHRKRSTVSMIETRSSITWMEGLPGIDSKAVVTAGIDGKLALWDYRYPKGVVQSFHGHTNRVNPSLRGTLDSTGRYLFIGGSDGKLRAWNVVTGALLLEKRVPVSSSNYGIDYIAEMSHMRTSNKNNEECCINVCAWSGSDHNGLVVGTAHGIFNVRPHFDSGNKQL